jgi:hypothetical protein
MRQGHFLSLSGDEIADYAERELQLAKGAIAAGSDALWPSQFMLSAHVLPVPISRARDAPPRLER